MKAKCFTTLLISFLSILAFAVEINPDTLKNPPSWVEVTPFDGNNLCLDLKEITLLTYPEYGKMYISPRVQRISDKYVCKIMFFSTKSNISALGIVNYKGEYIPCEITTKNHRKQPFSLVSY